MIPISFFRSIQVSVRLKLFNIIEFLVRSYKQRKKLVKKPFFPLFCFLRFLKHSLVLVRKWIRERDQNFIGRSKVFVSIILKKVELLGYSLIIAFLLSNNR